MMYPSAVAPPSGHLAVARPPRSLLTDPAGLFAELARLSLPRGHYVVCGSAALYVRGLRARMGDLDVLARGVAWNVALSLGMVAFAPGSAGSAVGLLGADSTLYTGPLTALSGGLDASFLTSGLVAGGMYLILHAFRRPAEPPVPIPAWRQEYLRSSAWALASRPAHTAARA
ncbi:hypothetical protein ACFLIM_37300 [Nonomuraea sp. M3C6]|uniref:Uncharacterized protein n=1 Tax=Nonomuraea marmarensis TaxID=3351344 RepID=A0ABW7ARH7_9ACTN